MAVKRIISKRLEKVAVAGETESTSAAFVEELVKRVITVGNIDPLINPQYTSQGNLWRNQATNPDTWNILINDSWINMLATPSEHGLLSNIDKSLINTATSVPTANSIVKYDASADLNAKSFNSISSRRFKTNITKIQQATELINQLEGVHFNWKKDGKADIGLIAEDVLEVIPEVVKVENLIVEGIAYDHLVAVLIEGFKEQNQLVNVLIEDSRKQQEQIDKILNHLGLNNE